MRGLGGGLGWADPGGAGDGGRGRSCRPCGAGEARGREVALVDAYGNTPEVGCTVVDTVEKLSGRPARTFGQWAAEHADAFTAQPPVVTA